MLEPCIQHWVFSVKKHWSASSWSLFEPSQFHPHFPPPISWSFQLPTNHPKVCEMPKNESTLENLRGSKWKFPLPNVAGDFFFGTPVASAGHTKHPPFSESVSIRACRPFPTEKYKEHTTKLAAHQILLTQVWAAKSSRFIFLSFQSGLYKYIHINHHNFSPRGFFVSFSWKNQLKVYLYMPSTIDFQRTCHAQTLKLQLKLRLLRPGGSRADGCKWRDVGPLYKWPYKRVSLGFFHA